MLANQGIGLAFQASWLDLIYRIVSALHLLKRSGRVAFDLSSFIYGMFDNRYFDFN